MRVWVVTLGGWDDRQPAAVFSSEEAADAAYPGMLTAVFGPFEIEEPEQPKPDPISQKIADAWNRKVDQIPDREQAEQVYPGGGRRASLRMPVASLEEGDTFQWASRWVTIDRFENDRGNGKCVWIHCHDNERTFRLSYYLDEAVVTR